MRFENLRFFYFSFLQQLRAIPVVTFFFLCCAHSSLVWYCSEAPVRACQTFVCVCALNLYFKAIANLQKICKNSTKNSLLPLTEVYQM